MTHAKVFLSLLALLGLTVLCAFLPLGAFAKPTSLLIATVKAALVMTYFMELRNEKPIIRIAALGGLLFLAFLFLITYADYLSRGMAGVLGK